MSTVANGILFLCVANSGLSQMAEGLAKRVLGPGAPVLSAPMGQRATSAYAATVMREVGIDLDQVRGAELHEIDPTAVELVITLYGDAPSEDMPCPDTLKERPRVHWAVPDPTESNDGSPEEKLSRFRAARDRLRGLIELFLSDELMSDERVHRDEPRVGKSAPPSVRARDPAA